MLTKFDTTNLQITFLSRYMRYKLYYLFIY